MDIQAKQAELAELLKNRKTQGALALSTGRAFLEIKIDNKIHRLETSTVLLGRAAGETSYSSISILGAGDEHLYLDTGRLPLSESLTLDARKHFFSYVPESRQPQFDYAGGHLHLVASDAGKTIFGEVDLKYYPVVNQHLCDIKGYFFVQIT